MDTPQSPIDNKCLTKTELQRLHDEIDFYDRHETLEAIYEVACSASLTDSPGTWFSKLEEIKSLASEFCA